MTKRLSRRALFKNAAMGIAAAAVAGSGGSATFAKKKENALAIDPRPRFELSPWLYMQFMEPLGTTDGSVAVAWDHLRNCWREEVIEVSRDLAPTLMRWGCRLPKLDLP